MIDWQIKSFKDIAQFPPKVVLEKSKSYSFIPMEEIDGVTKYVSPKLERTWNGTGGAKFENGDTLFARITPCLQNGKISQVKNLKDGKGFGSTEYFIFRGIENVSDNDFIYYLSKTEEFRKYAIGSMVGASGRQRADATFVGQYVVNLPPLKLQKRIAKILSSYDDLIENNLKRIKLLEEFGQRTYEEWFVNFRVNGVQLEVEENRLPQGWHKKPFYSITDIISGFPFKSNEYINNGKYKIVTIKNVQDGYFIPTTTDSLNELPSKVKHVHHLMTGDFILSLTGNVGRTCMVYGDDYLLNQRVAKIQCKEDKYNSFIYFLLRSKSTLINLENLSNGVAQQNLSPISIGNMDIVLSSENVILQFAAKFNNVLKLICNLNLQIKSLKKSRDVLLPRLMSGKIDVEEVLEIV